MPDAVALGGGAVWVLQTGGELGEKDEVVRIDPVNGRLTRRTALPGFLCPLGGGLTVSAGKVWVTDPKTGGLYRIDMETGALVRRDLGDEAARHVAGFGAIWVCAANPGSSMLRVDPDNIRATFVAAGIPPEDGTFAVGGGSIWRHDEPNGTLLRFEPNGRLAATVRITPTPPDMDLPSLKPTAVAVGAGGVWVTVAHF